MGACRGLSNWLVLVTRLAARSGWGVVVVGVCSPWFGVLVFFTHQQREEDQQTGLQGRQRLVDGGRVWERLCVHLGGGFGLILLVGV